MKISCQSCQSKYTIADDKVSGKVVKIRCKKCGATIVVNGSDGSSAGAQSYVPDMPTAEGGWMVNVAEGDQRTMTDDEVVAAFQAGVVNDETFCWRDGMADWLPLREIEQLSEACNATSALQAPPVAAAPAPAPSAARGGRAGANGGAEPAAAAPAARRVAGRQGGDLFSSAAQAGGEDDVMTSAPVGAPQARPAAVDDKMTGERNENSVLFSLSALTSKGTGPTKPTNPGVEASGLIDIRQLSAQLNSTDDKKRSRIDDIMNLAGGGAFSPSLSGPILSAPTVSEYTAPEEAAAPAAGQGRGRGVVIAAAAAGVLVIVGAIGTAFMMMKGKPDADKDKPGSSAGEMASAPGAASAAASAAPSASAAPAASETAAASASAAPAPESAPAAPKVASNTAATPGPKAAPKETPAPAPAGGNSLQAAMAGGAAPAPAAAAGGGAEPFNMGEAKARLAAAAAAAQGCKKGDGPSGTGRVVVMFAPSGAAQSATVSGPPFEGTPTGACVSARFRGVHVPAFSGSPFSVSKSFTIN